MTHFYPHLTEIYSKISFFKKIPFVPYYQKSVFFLFTGIGKRVVFFFFCLINDIRFGCRTQGSDERGSCLPETCNYFSLTSSTFDLFQQQRERERDMEWERENSDYFDASLIKAGILWVSLFLCMLPTCMWPDRTKINLWIHVYFIWILDRGILEIDENKINKKVKTRLKIGIKLYNRYDLRLLLSFLGSVLLS